MQEKLEFAVPEVNDALELDSTIDGLHKEIASDCARLLKRAREIDGSSPKIKAFRLRYWEGQIDQIREAQMATANIEELQCLRQRCQLTLKQMDRFSK